MALYRQDGAGGFTEHTRFEPLMDTTGELLDFDNDGDLDLAYIGTQAPFTPTFKLYLNNGGAFIDVSPASDFFSVPFTFGDYDRDGDLDLATLGSLFRNNALKTNTPPTAPVNLAAMVDGEEVTFTWVAATDANQSAAPTYNLRVGRTPGGVEVVSPLADLATGWRYVVAPGNAWHSGRWKLRNLAPGTYYWSVQAIDHSFAGGPFAAEQTFTIGGAPAPRFVTTVADQSGQLQLTVESPTSGRYILETSPDLQTWSELSRHDLAAGASMVLTPLGTDTVQFFRLRQE